MEAKISELDGKFKALNMILEKMDFEKTMQTSVEKQSKQVQNIKLPKLQIRKFRGKFSDWFPFWNTFEAEIDSTDLPAVSKFGFLKELLEPKIRADIDGLPFTTEGYERAKNILKTSMVKRVKSSMLTFRI